MKEYRYETRNLSLVGFFNDVTAVVPEQTGTKPPRREIRAGPNKRCNTIYVIDKREDAAPPPLQVNTDQWNALLSKRLR